MSVLSNPTGLLSFALDMLPSEWQGKAKDFFTYSVEFLALAAAGTGTDRFTTQADSGFLIVAAVGSARTTAAGVPSVADRPALLSFRDSGSGRQLQDTPFDFDNLVGTAQLPSVWPAPKFLNPQSTFTVDITSLAAVALSFRINFLGFKIFTTDMGGGGYSGSY